MGALVVNNAICACSFGMMPAPLGVLPVSGAMVSSQPAATIMDNIPFVNVRPFAMCTSIANPAVLAATVSAFGVLTPMPCTPVTPFPWIVGAPTALCQGKPLLDNTGTLMCAFGGVIKIVFPGQVNATV